MVVAFHKDSAIQITAPHGREFPEITALMGQISGLIHNLNIVPKGHFSKQIFSQKDRSAYIVLRRKQYSDEDPLEDYLLVYDADCGPCTKFKRAVDWLDKYNHLRYASLVDADACGLLNSIPKHKGIDPST